MDMLLRFGDFVSEGTHSDTEFVRAVPVKDDIKVAVDQIGAMTGAVGLYYGGFKFTFG